MCDILFKDCRAMDKVLLFFSVCVVSHPISGLYPKANTIRPGQGGLSEERTGTIGINLGKARGGDSALLILVLLSLCHG